MIALDALIESTRAAIPTLPTKQAREKQRLVLGWLVNLRDIVGGEMMVSRTAVIAAAAWIEPKEYVEFLQKRDGVK